MKDYLRILVCTDFSESSMAAARRGANLAHRYSATLILLHVIEHFPEDIPNDPITPENRDSAEFYQERARQNLLELAEKLGNKNTTQQVIMSTGSARYEIRRFAEKERIDLIVLGSHGRSIIQSFGSTAMGVTYDVPCDVMVVSGTE
jgi:universal stress protein A